MSTRDGLFLAENDSRELAITKSEKRESEERTANREKRICIIGSGPAGCYLAEHLLRLLPSARIDILERLPVPFGLVRYGVAPDHQGTKAVARVFDRTLSRDRLRFFGNVEVGRDVALDELRSIYGVVVLATGCGRDRRLGIPGETLPGVLGSSEFVNWYNGHPASREVRLEGVHSALIIGNGNVALDVARILAKDRGELLGSDLPPQVLEALSSSQIREVHVVGRRGPADARFTPHELEELGSLQSARPVIEQPGLLAGDSAVVAVFRQFAEKSSPDAVKTVTFHFQLSPVAFRGEGRMEAVLFHSGDGQEREIEAQLAITCIGYEAVSCCTAMPVNGVFANEGGKVEEGLYVVGWAKRGPSGTIPTNRTEAQTVAQKIAEELSRIPPKEDPRDSLPEKLRERNIRWVDYASWKRIEAAELAGACDERCRLKLTRVEEMLQVACHGESVPQSELSGWEGSS